VPVRWGFLGAGAVATRFVGPAVHAAANAELYAVAARDPARAATLNPTGRVVAAYDEVLADSDVDAVYVALANDAHHQWTLAALRAGKHVLCEKPLGLSAAEVDGMVATAQAAGRVLVEALWYRWHPQIRLAQELVAAGRIGTVRRVEAGFGVGGVAPGFRLDPGRGGGSLYDLGCYPISAALWAFGASPETVVATTTRGDSGVDVAADVRLTFPAGDAVVHVGMAEPSWQWLTIIGADARLEVPDRPFAAWFGPDGVVRVGDEALTVPAADPYRLMVEEVSAAVSGEGAFVVPLAETRAVAAVIDAALACAACNKNSSSNG
jgi:predicted dehydrogenase